MSNVKVDVDVDAVVEAPSIPPTLFGFVGHLATSMSDNRCPAVAACVVCERPLHPGRFVLYEIAGLSLVQHLSCFSRGVIHGYRVLSPSSPPVVVTVCSGHIGAKASL